MRLFSSVFLIFTIAPIATAATLAVEVRNARGTPIGDAVVYAVPDDRDVTPTRRTVTMDQKNRTFVPHILPIQTGTAVQFPNSDDIRHQVYSFSPAKTFQLPLYKGTPANPIVFEKPGVVTLGCNIHDRMTAYIVVVPTPYFASTSSGRASLPNLGAGKYTVHVWTPDSESTAVPVTLATSERRDLVIVAR